MWSRAVIQKPVICYVAENASPALRFLEVVKRASFDYET
jgi:hypothetical protein